MIHLNHTLPCSLALSFALYTLCVGAATTSAASYNLPPTSVDIVGQIHVVRAGYEDTLADVARRYGLGQDEIVLANPQVDKWLPGEGTSLVLPTRYILPDARRDGVVINLPEMRLYYFPKPRSGERPQVITHPVSVGRMDWSTPLGLTKVSAKTKDPAWYPPESIRQEHAASGDPLPKIVPAGPDNPLGAFALRLALPGYLIHGTNRPYGVGMRVTHGCLRMYPEDIERLFPAVPVGTPVQLVNQPVKAAMIADTLFLEVHPPLDELPMDEAEAFRVALVAIEKAAGAGYPGLDERRALEVIRRASGTPEVVSRRVLAR
jgi:L,D-transpeptidase ErfK/SrfK